MRADARRNRQRLLEVAEEVFAEHGAGASTEAIARAAGVGIGTVFRHFPTKEELLRAVFAEHLRKFTEEVESLTRAADPGDEFFAFCRRFLDSAQRKKALTDALADAGIEVDGESRPAKEQFRQAMDELVTRAQQAGALRPDVDGTDVLALLVGAAKAAEQFGKRGLEVIIDGLRCDECGTRPRPSAS
ncbi:TetR/AcrR family transcriptional regulator [Sciscionella sediminilitoris]|uniref:TetR/AcrR family transcriptional regulator n=1 Tax=Sciscionella sediminilitoris TaxID=1445613 RepID=UPI00056CB41A|nr:TetR/AcrR family transcriptional regulator [Sciscionella sp. SE31]